MPATLIKITPPSSDQRGFKSVNILNEKDYSELCIVAALLMAGCGSSKKQVEIGNYDAAINKAVTALRKNPNSSKDIESLERAMNIALEQDNERIRYPESGRKGQRLGRDLPYL